MVPNDGGRVVDPQTGEPVRRRVRRGLDQARADRLHRHQQVVRAADRAATWSTITTPGCCPTRSAKPAALDQLVRARQPDVVDARRMAGHRRRRDRARRDEDRPRNKFTDGRRHARGRGRRSAGAAACGAGCWTRLLGLAGSPALHIAAAISSDADLAHRLPQRPVVAERVADDAVAVAPELVLQRRDDGRARVERPLERRRRRR